MSEKKHVSEPEMFQLYYLNHFIHLEQYQQCQVPVVDVVKVVLAVILVVLHININKTVAMLFHTKQKRVNIDENLIVIDGKIIPFTTNTKFLGINIDNNLIRKAHINHITKKISKGVGVLLRLSKELSYNM